jgi:hypothetical protein
MRENGRRGWGKSVCGAGLSIIIAGEWARSLINRGGLIMMALTLEMIWMLPWE